MTDSFDLVRDLPPALASRPAAWDFVRGFAETWSTPLKPGDGTPETELTAAEESLGIRLPAAIREAYMLFGRREDPHKAEVGTDRGTGLVSAHDIAGLLLMHRIDDGRDDVGGPLVQPMPLAGEAE